MRIIWRLAKRIKIILTNNTKIVSCFITAGILMLAVTACGNSNQGLSSNSNSNKNSLIVNSVQEQKEINSKVVSKSNSDPVLKHIYKNFKDIFNAKDSKATVEAQVIKTEYGVGEYALPYTITTLKVNKVLKGSAPQEITAYEDGGFVPLRVQQEENQDKVPNSTPTADPNALVDSTFMGGTHPQIGSTVILSIQGNLPEYNLPANAEYIVCGGPTGRFTQEANGNLARATRENGWENTVTKEKASLVLKSL